MMMMMMMMMMACSAIYDRLLSFWCREPDDENFTVAVRYSTSRQCHRSIIYGWKSHIYHRTYLEEKCKNVGHNPSPSWVPVRPVMCLAIPLWSQSRHLFREQPGWHLQHWSGGRPSRIDMTPQSMVAAVCSARLATWPKSEFRWQVNVSTGPVILSYALNNSQHASKHHHNQKSASLITITHFWVNYQ